ncbi:MAG: flagellar hook basal-body protein [Candidatus Melainabacteria bacterium]|nr:flagellar hook basal-body protein [Candidatus Melainabacteria bacterium]MBI3309624.1 flagellar hook basal-body protein [Candidatus Melainabacteria bacterium]
MYTKLGNQVLRTTQAGSEALANIVDNISNIKTLGYKKQETSFVETLNGEISKHQNSDFSQGLLSRTGQEFDFAIDGKGFFEVELPSGQRGYTRVGAFSLSADGELVTAEGHKVLPRIEQTSIPKLINSQGGLNLQVSKPKLIIPAHLTPEVDEGGNIYGLNEQTGEKTKFGKISVVAFNNPSGLKPMDRGYYLETKDSGAPQEIETGINAKTQVKQGFVEQSNVDMASEFMNLAQMKNVLTAQLKVLKAIDKIYENIHFTISRST